VVTITDTSGRRRSSGRRRRIAGDNASVAGGEGGTRVGECRLSREESSPKSVAIPTPAK